MEENINDLKAKHYDLCFEISELQKTIISKNEEAIALNKRIRELTKTEAEAPKKG